MTEELSFFQQLNDKGHLEGLEIDKDEILRQIGLGKVSGGLFRWSDLSTFSAEESYDTAIKCVRFQEYVAENLALTQRRRGTVEANLDKILNSSIAANKGMKITESRALAKGSDAYTSKLEEVETLKSWENYLETLIDLLEKYHYLAKSRLNAIQSANKGV